MNAWLARLPLARRPGICTTSCDAASQRNVVDTSSNGRRRRATLPRMPQINRPSRERQHFGVGVTYLEKVLRTITTSPEACPPSAPSGPACNECESGCQKAPLAISASPPLFLEAALNRRRRQERSNIASLTGNTSAAIESHSNQANRSATNAMIQTTPSTRPDRSISSAQDASTRRVPAPFSQAINTPKPTRPAVGQK